MNITITGDIGAGKSSVVKELEQQGFKRYYAGTAYRKYAEDHNVTLEEVHRKASEDKTFDTTIDNMMAEYCSEHDGLVIDARLGWHFVPNAYHVYLKCDAAVGAARVFSDVRTEEHYDSLIDCFYAIQERREIEIERFNALYDIDMLNPKNYNIIINTSVATPAMVASVILSTIDEYMDKRGACVNSLHAGVCEPAFYNKMNEVNKLLKSYNGAPYLYGVQANEVIEKINSYGAELSIYVVDNIGWLKMLQTRLKDRQIQLCDKQDIYRLLDAGHIIVWKGSVLWVGKDSK